MKLATLMAGTFALTLAISMSEAFTTGDPVEGETVFRKCSSCHSVEAGRTRPNGPNLLGVFGRQAGMADYSFGASLVEAGEAGLVWTPETMDAYLEDPTAFLEETLGVSRVRDKMRFKLKKGDQRADVIAYLMSLQE